jgi:ADP-heptose:LPS heptosyltransferase
VGFFPAFDVVLPRDYSKHSSELAFDVARWVDPLAKLEDFASPPRLPESASSFAGALRRQLREVRLMAVHADSQPEKCWPWGLFRVFLEAFLEAHPDYVAILIGQRTAATSAPVAAERVLCLRDLPLAETLAVVGICDLFVGIDSCFLHAADLFRVPGIGLFGPTEPAEFGFRFARHRHVRAGSDVRDITIGDVLGAAHGLLGTCGTMDWNG